MKESIDLSGTRVGADEAAAVVELCEALRNAPNLDIQSIILYGSATGQGYRPGKSDINLLIIVERIDVAILKGVLDPIMRGRRYGISPFFITEVNLRSSADVFPVKFLVMQESYTVLLGRDVLGELEIKREHLRLRCEQEIKNLLLRLRRHYIMSGGQRLTEMMTTMVVGFLETLRVVLSLNQQSLLPREDVVHAAARTFGVDSQVLQDVSALRTQNVVLSSDEAEQLYDKFMGVVDKLARITDQMK
ncbi:MAG: hypothetical protein JSV40_13075 [Deltaproteobacteria bacterium]|nr:MAG: hypothetical protein JSV40_13075 [Deltaproteobacteria bacterium]